MTPDPRRLAGKNPSRAPAVAEARAGGTRCWCGEPDLQPLRPDYGRCPGCGTVVYTEPYDPAEYTSTEPSGFYGDRYWEEHVPERLGLPRLEERARSDLSERAVFHLARILEHLGPGARVLELGCGAGSLTYLLRRAGLDAAGLEMSPAAIELGRRHFGLEVHRGPLEELELEGDLDAIVAVDVLEHLPHPLSMMKLCARRLASDGLLLLQTPCYRDDGSEWEMLLPGEHLHLFTEESIERMLREAGFVAVEVRGSLFPYDMWVVAARRLPLVRRPHPLAGVPPVAVALIDAYAALVRAQGERDAVDSDRQLKEQDCERLLRELRAVRQDQQAKDELVGRQDAELRRLRDDQRQKGKLIDRQDAELEEVRSDQSAKGELIDRLAGELAEVRSDRSAKGELIARLATELEEVRGDQSAKGELIDQLSAELEEVRSDQAAKEQVIQRLSTALEKAKAELRQRRSELQKVHDDRLYRLVRAARARLGRLRR